MKLLFLVNGAPGSAAATRTEAFAQRLPKDWRIETAFRPARKPLGIATFTRAALAMRPDIIYVMDTAYSGVLAGALVRRALWRRARLIVDTGDAAFALAKSVGTVGPRGLELIRRVEEMALTRSDAVVVRGSFHKTLLEMGGEGGASRPLSADKVVFVPDGVDLNETHPVDASALRAKLGLADSLVVGMVGSMVWSEKHRMCYGWDIVEALAHLKDVPQVRALLVGDGDGRAILEARAKELGVSERIVWTGNLPYKELPAYLCAMDVCVSTQSNDVVGNVRTTGKLPLYLACGRYVAATNAGEARNVLRDGVGCLLPYEGVRDDGHPARLAAHLRELIAEPSRLNVAEKARQAACERFDYDMLTRRVQSLCERLTTR